jgi:amino acid adenylation domain-containing protein
MPSRNTTRIEPLTLVDLLRWRTDQTPDRRGYTFLIDGEKPAYHVTYGDLDRQARAIAASLQMIQAQGKRALLLFPPGLDYIAAFFGCLYAGVVAVPAYPPQRKRTLPRLKAILSDAAAKVVLTTSEVHLTVARLSDPLPEMGEFKNLQWINVDRIERNLEEGWKRPTISAESLTLFQYTSGSTGTPKGVMLSHSNLLHNQRMIREGFGHTEASVVVGWLPLYHDMGLIGNLLQPLYVGFPCILMSPASFLQRPFRWLQAISRYRATTSGGPNFAYDLCVEKIVPEQRSTLDLSCWSVAFNGSEPIQAASLERFAEAFGPCGFHREAFYPCYGLAEATLFVSGGLPLDPPRLYTVDKKALEAHRVVEAEEGREEDVWPLVSSGRTRLDQQVRIVDPISLILCADGEVGEIWVKGPSVAKGYFNRPEETEQTFRAYLKEENRCQTSGPVTGEGPYLRTGDLGFLHQGELFVTGRLKDLIIIRGRNHYPHDIEWTAQQSHPGLRPGGGAAFSVDVDDEERLVVVQEVAYRLQPDVEEVASTIRQAVAETHGIEVDTVVLIEPGTLPKTSSGKIERHTCRDRFLAGHLEEVGRSLKRDPCVTKGLVVPRTPIEKAVAEIWEEVLGCDRIGLHDHFFTLGGDSLRGTQLLSRLRDAFQIDLSFDSLFEKPTVAGLAEEIEKELGRRTGGEAQPGQSIPLRPVPRDREFSLSLAQQRLWFLQRLEPDSPRYHLAGGLRLTGRLDITALERSLHEVFCRHEALRTCFPMVEGEPVQAVLPEGALSVVIDDLRPFPEAGRAAEAQRRVMGVIRHPFDLEKRPPMRAGLLQLSDQTHLFWLSLHHLIFDGLSSEIFLRELAALYEAEVTSRPARIPPLPVQYVDHAVWQRQSLSGEALERPLAYWKRQLLGAPAALALPTDRPRPTAQSDRGAIYPFTVSEELARRLCLLGRRQEGTLFMTLLAAWKALLYRYTGQGDLCVGTPIAGRNRSEIEGVIGFFVNTLVLRTDLSDNPPFTTLLRRVQKTVLGAQAHQDLPFEKLVEALQPARDLSYTPLFQVMFSWRNAPLPALEVAGLHICPMEIHTGTAKFDLTLEMTKVPEGLRGAFEYSTDLFDEETVVRMARHYRTLLEGIAAHPEARLSDLPMLTETERHQVLVEWNATEAGYPQDRCIHQLFEAQAERTPEAVAVIFEERQLTYQELNARADQLARHLRRQGIGPDVLVGLCMERSIEMVVGLLGILKAGGAYLPIDPNYPRERIAFVLEDTQVSVLLTQQKLLECLPETQACRVCVDGDFPPDSSFPAAGLQRPAPDPQNLAYVLYTSGSTGRPKGVAIAHRSAVALLAWAREVFSPEEVTGVLASTSICFDLSVFELFVPLSWGGKVILVENALHLPVLAARQDVTLVNTVPSAIGELIRYNGLAPSVRVVNLAGESLQGTLVQRIYQQKATLKIFNLYGPSEDTTYSTFALIKKEDQGSPPIGRPIANTQIYILESDLQPVPIGIPGEIYIGRAGLARGYLNHPDLTAERFIPDPFGQEPGRRLYRTGDLGRWRPDGNIEFLGRIDHQVKVRGYRIELGEIETRLAEHPGVKEAVVVAREDRSEEKRLVAYVVAEGALQPEALRGALRESLPEYMIPSAFVFLDKLPLTPNGKIDRKALPMPEISAQLEDRYVAPHTPTEEILAGIWAEVLGVERVGIHDNFFDLGGHSLLLVQVHRRLEEAFRRPIPIVALFQYPTLHTLAKYVAREEGEQFAFHHHQERARRQREALGRQKKRGRKIS